MLARMCLPNMITSGNCCAVMSAFGGKFKLKNRASGRTGRHPDPALVALDDRLADRETQSHSAGLGREHWFENTIEVGWINSASGIRNRDLYTVAFSNFRFYGQYEVVLPNSSTRSRSS